MTRINKEKTSASPLWKGPGREAHHHPALATYLHMRLVYLTAGASWSSAPRVPPCRTPRTSKALSKQPGWVSLRGARARLGETASCGPAADMMGCRRAGGGFYSPPRVVVESLSTVDHRPRPTLKRASSACVFVFCLILTCDQNQFDLNPRRVSLLNIYTSDTQPGVQRQ